MSVRTQRVEEHNSDIRRRGEVFVGGVNQTQCGRCGERGAEYHGDLDDEGRSLALCPQGQGCADPDADDW